MNISVIIVGIGEWEEYTRPLILSIKRYEPNVNIILVDNGIRYLPKYSKFFGKYDIVVNPTWKGLTNHDLEEQIPSSYATAINCGMGMVNEYDWAIIVNNDVICEAPFVDYLKTLNNETIYGNKLHYSHKLFEPLCPWVDGWIYAIPRKVIEDIGKWDTNFKIAGFEDADYCFRAYKLCYDIGESELPFIHLERHIRKEFKDYSKHRQDNIDYLMRKHELKQIQEYT